jgi:phage virion morphogenesis protein
LCLIGKAFATGDLQVDAAADKLSKLDAALVNPESLMPRLGEYLRGSTRDRVKTMRAPDGSPWAPLSPLYQKSKRQNKDKILTLRGYLGNQIAVQFEGRDTVPVGSNRVYARIHQFGGVIKPRRAKALRIGGNLRGSAKIPARPFLGLSREDHQEVIAITKDWLEQQIG